MSTNFERKVNTENKDVIKRIESSLDSFEKKQTNDVDHSIEVANETLKLSNNIDYKIGAMKSLHILGSSYIIKGNTEKSIDYLIKSLVIANEIDNKTYKLKCFTSLGNMNFYIQNYKLALEYYNKVLKISNELNNKAYEAKALNNIGEIYNNLESYDEALKYYKKCEVITNTIGDDIGFGISLLNVGDIYFHFNDYENAKSYVNEAIKILQKANYKISEAEAYQVLGKIYYKQNYNDKALYYFNKSFDISNYISNNLHKIDVLIDIHSIYKKENQNLKAIDKLKQALKISEELNEVSRISKVCSLLAIMYEKVNDYKEALNYYKIFHDIEKKEGVVRQDQLLNSVKVHMKMEQTNSEKEIYRRKNIELEQKNDELEESYKKVQVISDIGQQITSTLDLEEIVNVVYDNVDKLMDSYVFGLGLYDKNKELISYKLYIENGKKLKPYTKSSNSKHSFAAQCIRNREAIMINDMYNSLGSEFYNYFSSLEDRNKSIEGLPSSLIYCPLIVQNEVIGMITVQSLNKNAYNNYNLDTLKALASYIAIAINNAKKSLELSLEIKDRKEIQNDLEKANEELLKLTHIDPLTKVLNRRRFIEVLDIEWNKCRKTSDYISLIMIDVDKFKEYNDNYGHLAGDSVLVKIAKALKNTLERTTDYVARYGGDEFIVVLPRTSSEYAIKIGQKIINSIRNLNIEHQYSNVSDIVTLTLGVSSVIPSDDKRIEEIIHQADEALYEAKSKGRNCIDFL